MTEPFDLWLNRSTTMFTQVDFIKALMFTQVDIITIFTQVDFIKTMDVYTGRCI